MISGRQVAVGTSPTLLTSAAPDRQGGQSFLAKNKTTAAASVFLGGSAVAASGGAIGYELQPGDTLSADVDGDDIYGIVLSGTVTLHIFERGL